MTHQAKAIIIGEIANKRPLQVSQRGFLGTNIRVDYTNAKGRQGSNYLNLKWFEPDSFEIADQFQPGDEVYIEARIGTEKDKESEQWVLQLVGTSMKLAGELGDIADQFGATPVADYEDSIPF
jgi:single-stranded DNA-binding protein